MSADTTVVSTQTQVVEEGIVRDDRGRVHENAVADIVGMIRAKYEDEGTRNFAIGRRAFEHATWQKANFPGYTGSDFDALMRRIRDDVRLYVPIKAESIRVDDWVRIHVLRDLVTQGIGEDLAAKLSFHEYAHLVGKALSFDKKAVSGGLKDGWLDLVRQIAGERMAGGRITSEDLLGRIAAHEKAVKAAADAANPQLAAAVATAEALTKKADDVRKANKSVTSAVSDAMAKGHLDPTAVLGIVETVAKGLKQPLPSHIGFDPAACTVEDCILLASTMFQHGKFAEMKALRDRLDKMVSAVEKSTAVSQSTQDRAASGIEPATVKIAREQKKAERKLAKTGS